MVTFTSASPSEDAAVVLHSDHAMPDKTLIAHVIEGRAWLFLLALVMSFELCSRLVFGTTFAFAPFNLQSVAVFAVAPLLLATGQTFVIISGGIDLSIGFIMGLAAVIAVHATNLANSLLADPLEMVCGVIAAVLAAMVSGALNGLLISRLRVPLWPARSILPGSAPGPPTRGSRSCSTASPPS
jgi:ribose transport system permease protein